MLRNGRIDFSTIHFSKLTTVTLAGALATLIGGCSAEVLRFDPPNLGFKGPARETARPTAPPNQAFYNEAPAPTGRVEGYGRGRISKEPVTSGNVTRSELPKSQPDYRAAPSYRTAPTYQRPRAEPTRTEPPRRTALLPPATERRVPARRSYETNDMPESVVVSPGDTLYDLSRRYGLTVGEIKRANGLTSNIIKPGQRLALRDDRQPEEPARYQSRRYGQPRRQPAVTAPLPPAGDYETYTVRSGDSLYAIARRTGVKVAALQELNAITNVRRLRPGTVLRLRPRAEEQPRRRTLPNYGQPRSPRLEPRTTERTPATEPRYDGNPGSNADPSTSRNPRILNPTRTRRVRSVRIPVTETPPPRTRTAKPVSEPPPRTVASGKFRWPVRGRIVRGFGKRPDGTKNDGVDIAVPIGTEVHAAETGVVAYAGDELKGYGNLILIRHEDGWVSAYAHNDKVMVKRGDTVRRGQIIAKAGKTGNVNQPVLHFELRKGAKPINPLPHLAML